MNLYSIDFGHWSQKDSQQGIKGYLLAESDEKVLVRMSAQDVRELNGDSFYIPWKSWLEDNGGTPTPKKYKRLLKKRGQLYDDRALENLSDLYYGATLYGWTLVKEVSPEEAQTLLHVGIATQA